MRKRLFLIIASFLCIMTASAQDILVKSDGTALKVKVQEIGESVVKYYRHDNLSGPLYTIPIASILSITYENGTTENFGKTAAPIESAAQTAAETSLTPQNVNGFNENELYRIANQMQYGKQFASEGEYYANKAKKYRKIAWYGGGVIALVGIATTIITVSREDWGEFGAYFGIYGAPIIGAGAAWCLAWNLAANNQMKKAHYAMAYSQPIMEWNLLEDANKSLSASVNVMGNNSVQHRNYGLGLGLNLTF